ncbi:peptidoglycan DD-metalloendopeptidase family protein [Streptomyces sp. QTS137]
MPVEGPARERGGGHRIVGGHLAPDLGDATYAPWAHLRRGSFTVREGDGTRAGQVLARCGDSGNSAEPHLRFQLMDGPGPDTSRGVPFTRRGIGVPRGGEVFDVPGPATATPA